MKKLPEVGQDFTADASKYLAELDKMVERNDRVHNSLGDIGRDLDTFKRQLDDFERNLPDIKLDFMKPKDFDDALGGIQDNIMKLAGDALKANADMEAAWGKQTDVIKEFGTQIDRVGTQVGEVHTTISNFADVADRMGTSVDRATTSVNDLHVTGQRVRSEGSIASVASDLYDVQSAADNATQSVSAVADAIELANRRASQAGGGAGLAAVAALLGMHGGGGGGGGGVTASILGALGSHGAGNFLTQPDWLAGLGGGALAGGALAGILTNAARNRGTSVPAMIGGALAGGMGTGGGGPGWQFLGNFGQRSGQPGTAAALFDGTIAPFLGTWLPRLHYAMMGFNEIMATLGPAAIAAGMGGLVGMQGAEQVMPRGQAIFATSESLGPSLGITAGTYSGLKQAYLQNAQNQATGLASNLVGAGINIGNMGVGGAFAQLGLNVDAMTSGAAAGLVQDFQHGVFKQATGLIAQTGAGYLGQVGSILSNLGMTFVHAAPVLPGVGGDILSTVQGATGLLSKGTGWLGGMLGPILAGEAGLRYGPGIVGAAGSMLARSGALLKIGGAGLADAGVLGGGVGGGVLDMLGTGVGRAGLALGAMGAPQIAIAAGAAYTLAKDWTYKTPQQAWSDQYMSNINQMGIAPSLPHILYGIGEAKSVPYQKGVNWWQSGLSNIGQGFSNQLSGLIHGRPGELWSGVTEWGHGLMQMLGFKGADENSWQLAQDRLQALGTDFTNVVNSGKQVQTLWKGLGGGAITAAGAFDVMTMAQLQLGTAFDKTGKLTAKAKQQIADTYAGYQPMMMNGGEFGNAVAAQTAMSGLQHTQIAAVNQAYDQLTSLVQGGAAASSSFFGMLGGTPVASTRGSVRGAVPSAFKGFSGALGSFTSAQGAANWNLLTNPQSGMFPALEQNMDWLREVQTMQGLKPGQVAGMGAYEIAQMLPILGKNPAGLAMLSTYAQQFGGPTFAPGTSGATMQKVLKAWVSQNGLSNAGFNNLMTLGTESLAGTGRDANVFAQQVGSGLTGSSLAAGLSNYGSQLMQNFIKVAGHSGTANALSQLGNFMFGSGTSLKGAEGMVSYAAKLTGAGPSSIDAMMKQLQKEYTIYIKTHVDPPKVPPPPKAPGTVDYESKMKSLHIPPPPKGGTVNYPSKVEHPVAPPPPPGGTVVYHSIVLPPGAGGSFGRISQSTASHFQTGGLVPGSGFGDIVPAMLEPGEVIIPRNLVPMLQPFLQAHKIPGFGMPQSSSSHFAAGGIVPSGASASQIQSLINTDWGFLNQLYSSGNQAAINAYWKNTMDPLYKALDALKGKATSTSSALNGLTNNQLITKYANALGIPPANLGATGASAATTAAAQKIATTLENQIKTQLAFAQNVSQNAQAGLNLGSMTAGLGGSANPVPPGHPGFNATAWNNYVTNFANNTAPAQTVQQQMQSYLGTLKSFNKDLGTLGKDHLSKSLLNQLIQAGPTQGDALAQSILSDPSGVKGANSLWSQIVKQSNILGLTAANAYYGHPAGSASTKSGNATIAVNVNVGGAGTTFTLSQSQINQIVAQVQAKLLQQARRNQKTGVQAGGKGA